MDASTSSLSSLLSSRRSRSPACIWKSRRLPPTIRGYPLGPAFRLSRRILPFTKPARPPLPPMRRPMLPPPAVMRPPMPMPGRPPLGAPVGPMMRPPMPMGPPGGLPLNMPGPGAMRLPSSDAGGPMPALSPINPLAGSIPQAPPPGAGMPPTGGLAGLLSAMGGRPGGPGGPGGPPPPAPPPPPEPPTIYELMEQADDAGLAELLLDRAQGSKKDGPVYPSWFTRPTRPDVASITGWAEEDRRVWRVRNEEIEDDLSVMRNAKVACFPEDAERWWYQPFESPELMNESEQATDIIGGLPKAVTVPYTDPSQQDEAQDAKDALHWFWSEIDARYASGGSTSRKRDKAWYAVNMGWTAERLTPNPLDPTFPFEYALLDPRTVYPTWDGPRGLQRVVVVSRQKIAAVIGDFDGGKGTVRKKLFATARGSNRAMTDRDCLNQTVEVIEYWDPWWRCVLVEGDEVIPVTAHKYGRVPFRVQACGKGAPLSASAALSASSDTSWSRYGVARSDPGQRFMSTGLIRAQKRRFQQQQMVLGKQMTAIRHADNPAMTYTQGPFGDEATPDVSNEPGVVNPLGQGAAISPFMPQVNADLMGPIMAMLQKDAMQGGMAQSQSGNMDKSNVTGVAVDMLNEAGVRKLLPFIDGVDRGDAGILEDFLRIVRDWGHLFGPDGKRGKIAVPRAAPKPGQPPAFPLMPETVKTLFGDGDPRVKVESISLSGQQKLQVLNMANMAKSSGLTSMEYWARELGVQNWPEEQSRMMREKAMTMPEVEKIRMYKDLLQSDDLKWLAPIFRRYALDKPSENDPGNADPSGNPGPPGGGGPSPMSGISLPMMGQPPGQMGGRPPMPLGPGPI